MKVLVVGSGGREHAIAWKIKQSPQLDELYCAPGNAGIAELANPVSIPAEDIQSLLEFTISKQIDLTVVGPEAPLVAGIADRFQESGRLVTGPSHAAALLEGSKAFAKDFMKRHAIPTANYQIFDHADTAEAALKGSQFQFPVVVKADGLAAGKGVFVCPDLAESLRALNLIMRERKFGAAGERLVIEEFLEGEEASFMVFSDGVNVLPMVPSQDHKAIYEGDRGPNTGGMGAYSVDAILSGELRQRILDEIIYPTIRGMAEEGNPYRGVLYAGLMITPAGPKVLEFNVRFGDPEAQVVLPRMETDLLTILHAAAADNLQHTALSWKSNAVVCVVIASGGYPGSYEKGKEISGLDMASEEENTIVFHSGTALKDDKVVTHGGRVLGVTSLAPTLETAIIRAYEGVNKIHFERMYYRRDIASKGLKKLERN
ncbi:phosphoribosylamine--glycine ligase [Acidobacteria bacterium AH-259-A15]|nr:phosphoribosylamine--glycine ligase [Acidobacteria bacterium AH-259-A15]